MESQIDSFEAEIEGVSVKKGKGRVKKGKGRPPRLVGERKHSLIKFGAFLLSNQFCFCLTDPSKDFYNST